VILVIPTSVIMSGESLFRWPLQIDHWEFLNHPFVKGKRSAAPNFFFLLCCHILKCSFNCKNNNNKKKSTAPLPVQYLDHTQTEWFFLLLFLTMDLIKMNYNWTIQGFINWVNAYSLLSPGSVYGIRAKDE